MIKKKKKKSRKKPSNSDFFKRNSSKDLSNPFVNHEASFSESKEGYSPDKIQNVLKRVL